MDSHPRLRIETSPPINRPSTSNRRVFSEGQYKADIGNGPLRVPESRIVAGLLLDGVTPEQWNRAIVDRNLLQRRSAATARRQALLIRSRLETMDRGLWKMVRDGSLTVSTQALFAAAIKHSPLLGDFVDLVVREQFSLFAKTLPRELWSRYLEVCQCRDPEIPPWAESTRRKLGQNVFQILAEVGLIESTRSLTLRRVELEREVLSYLKKQKETRVLRCLQVCHG